MSPSFQLPMPADLGVSVHSTGIGRPRRRSQRQQRVTIALNLVPVPRKMRKYCKQGANAPRYAAPLRAMPPMRIGAKKMEEMKLLPRGGPGEGQGRARGEPGEGKCADCGRRWAPGKVSLR